MIILGLTGSIGMGKTVIAKQFKSLGVPVFDSDKCIHDLLYNDKQVVASIKKQFLSTCQNGVINRGALSDIVFHDEVALSKLEKILHPIVASKRSKFIQLSQRRGINMVMLDIPLLYEKGADIACDGVIVVTAPFFVQRARVLKRIGMTEKKFTFILTKQYPDQKKQELADFIIKTGLGKNYSLRQSRKIKNLFS